VVAPRRIRHWGALLLGALQIAILATGNYGFFNLLTLALLIPLFDDVALRSMIPRRLRPAPLPRASDGTPFFVWRMLLRVALVPVAALLAVAAFYEMRTRLRLRPPPASVQRLLAPLHRLQSVNAYGLFAIMTTTRAEILVEG